ncbi:hypothetical protein IscW_ISCW000383 [Ixodes scapularis]|uniref:Uncharacterized protein n=1 Tax=Ixodes scapularis TaxID=6945 RepID=B7P3P2_IXOSC|nr:hypothetical protein IscW_ISCW000383 [Ixodes scapularis]|eukprot:XP_002404481.1 hypothetical protein IscW_ISCW000383 [Ixodes scapularis]
MGPLVGLLEIGLSEEAIDRRTVADHLGAATAHLRQLFTLLSRERREGVIARVAPDLRQMVAHDGGDEGSPLLFREGFLGQLRTRNETIKVLREARQPPPPAAEPAAKRPRSSAAPRTSAQSRSGGQQPFHRGPPFLRLHEGAYLHQGHRDKYQASRRVMDASSWKLCPFTFSRVNFLWGPVHMDLFADFSNHQVRHYYSWKPDPQAAAVDALSHDGTGQGLYAFPPFSLVSRCIAKLQTSNSLLILVAPVRPSQPWYASLLYHSYEEPRLLPQSHDLLRSHDGQVHPMLSTGTLILAA